MAEYGWNFVNTLVTDIRPDARVRESMNSINAAQREREAAVAQAEAEKIRVIKEAEGSAEARKLQGRGVAEQRKEIVEGIAAQYEMLRAAGIDESPEALMLVSQYLDAMVDVSSNSQSNVLFMPSNPGGMGDIFQGMRDVLMSSHALDKNDGSAKVADNKPRQISQSQSQYNPAQSQPSQQRQQQPQQVQSAREYFNEMRDQLRGGGQ